MIQSNAQPPDATGPRPELRILETRVLRGPNYWAREPVIRMVVDLGVLEDYPSNVVPGFTSTLKTSTILRGNGRDARTALRANE